MQKAPASPATTTPAGGDSAGRIVTRSHSQGPTVIYELPAVAAQVPAIPASAAAAESKRERSESSDVFSSDDADSGSQQQSRRKKSHVDEAVPSTSRAKSVSQLEKESIDAFAELHHTLSVQSAEISSLRLVVERQQKQIDTLLAVIGIPKPPADDHMAADGTGAVSTASTTGQQEGSYAAAVSRSVPLSKALKTAVVSAVYLDINDKGRRARNVVVNGLPTSNDDKASFSQLINDEFHLQPNVVHVRRLGRVQAGRVQPLLVVLNDNDEANHLLQNAKRLRDSLSDQVRSSVYINADLTQAEAAAAYQQRCERRERTARQSRGPQQQQQRAASSQSAVVLRPATTSMASSQLPATGQPVDTSIVASGGHD